ncbi:Crinkler (CRN) [Phytophthora megakarya]|uniref:Crinkler (CRN) n=1 Tax=Phytophthora megakarya TaxID=4795 RepID=A0A225VKH0_9STRA|nr:Crinkler (CRN) [Phytophthora megakarya]
MVDENEILSSYTIKDLLNESGYQLGPAGVRKHYNAWKTGNCDKLMHPRRGGPGTGKSRMLDEFPTLVTRDIMDEKNEDPEMMKLLNETFTFKVDFDNETAQQFELTNAAEAIGTRMYCTCITNFRIVWTGQNLLGHHLPTEVTSELLEIISSDEREMCVILCIDIMQKLPHETRWNSPFDSALGALSSIIDGSKCWVITIGSSTVFNPVMELMVLTSQWIYNVPTAVVSRPTVPGVDIFEMFESDKRMQLLIDDMGGHGRAVKTLYGVMSSRAKANQPLEFIPVMTDVMTELRS